MLRADKAIHGVYNMLNSSDIKFYYPENGRYGTYYAEDRLYLVFDNELQTEILRRLRGKV